MRTDDRGTRQPNEAEGSGATVVRLSDWLAADDELVPIGPRAGSGEANDVLTEAETESPAASGFWDGDTSMHTAVPGPGVFDESDERTAESPRHRRPDPLRRPALPSIRPLGWWPRTCDATTDVVRRVSWRWAAGGLAFVTLIVVVLVATLGGSSSDHHQTVARAGIGDRLPATLSATLGEIGTAGRTTSVTALQALPPVDTTGRKIGAAAQRAWVLEARHRRHSGATSVSAADPSTASTVESPASTSTPTETTPAPTETEPVQTTPVAPPSGGGGGSSSGGSTASSNKQPAFGATGSLGPGSSPNG